MMTKFRISPSGYIAWEEYPSGDVAGIYIWTEGARYYGEPIRTGQHYALRGLRTFRSLMEARAAEMQRPVRVWITIKHPAVRKALYRVFGQPTNWWSFIEIQPDGSIQWKTV